MDTLKKVIVGYDLCEDYTQISCYSYKTLEPIPISISEGEEYSPIPTVLCVKKDTKQWLYGEEAVTCANNGAGILLDHLLTRVLTGETAEIFQQIFTPVALLEKFLRKSLTLIKNYFPTEQITKLVVTVPSTNPMLVDAVYEALALLGLEKDRALVLSHAGAYLYYALNQDKALWMNDVGLFDFSEEGLFFYQIRMNRKTKPMIAGLAKKEYTETLSYDMLNRKDMNASYIFENIANTALFKQIISTLYFTGNGFEGGWADDVIKSLCAGRRIFMGQNLFTKGACYAAKELSGDKKLNEFILMNDDMITSSVMLRVYLDTKYQEVPLTVAGETWYEINKSIEVIPEGDAELEIILKDIMTRDVTREKIRLSQLPNRPERMTRLEINFTCKDKSTGIITVNDLGFGEIYPETGRIMEFSIEI
jgi:hypothetical protein